MTAGGELLALSDMLGDAVTELMKLALQFMWAQAAGIALITALMNRRLGPARAPIGVLVLVRWLVEVVLLGMAVMPSILAFAALGWWGLPVVLLTLVLARAGLWHVTLARMPGYRELPVAERVMGVGACVFGSLSFDGVAVLLWLPSSPLANWGA